jgi:glycine/D-amino acid oxidase-like deaminating enzyme
VSRRSFVIIGGGIAGLAAAWELSGGAGGPGSQDDRIEIIEATTSVARSRRRRSPSASSTRAQTDFSLDGPRRHSRRRTGL